MRFSLTCVAILSICAGIASGQTPAPPVPAASPAIGGDSFQELLGQLNAQIAGDLGSKPAAGENGRRVISLAAQLQRADTRGENEMVRSTLEELSEAMPTPQGKQIVAQLQQALAGEIEARKNAVTARISALRDKAARACLDSKKETDLDPVLNEIDAMQITLASQWEPLEREKLRATREFLEQWQKYVAQDAAGYQSRALATLRSIRDNPPPYPLVPLSSISFKIDSLAQSEPSERAKRILDGLTKLEDLPAAIAALKAIPLQNSQEFPALMIINQLIPLESGAAALKSGDYAAALASVSAVPAVNSVDLAIPQVIFRLREQLLTALLPSYLALPENPHPKPDENPEQYLLRLAGEAAARADYGEVSQILGGYKVCVFGADAPAWLDAGIAGSAAYFQGQNLERADSFAAALTAYNRVLVQAPSRFNPVAQAAARIAALRKDHPADFDKAEKSMSQPPPPPAPPEGG